MQIYRVSARKIDGFSILLNSCIENDINFRKFSLTNEVCDLGFITAEIETEALQYDLMKFLENHKAEKGFPVYWEGPIHKNIGNELKRARSIVPTGKTKEDFKKVEDQLSDFHGYLLAFFTVHEEMEAYGIHSQNFSYEFETALDWAHCFLYILKKQFGVLVNSDRISKIFEEMIEARYDYDRQMRDAGCLELHAELVEDAAAEDFDRKLEDFQSEYSSLANEFLEKLDDLIGENTSVRLQENVTA